MDKYFEDLELGIPDYILFPSLVAVCLLIVFAFVTGKEKKIFKEVLIVLLVEYVLLLLCTTVFCRESGTECKYELTPFWSYKEVIAGREKYLIAENMMNVLVFIPIGFLLATMSRHKWYLVVAFGLILSAAIEVLQLVTCRGLCEMDDVIHNTLGCLIGYGIYELIKRTLHYANT